MSRKMWCMVSAIFVLVQEIAPQAALSFESGALAPSTNIDINYSTDRLKRLYDAMCLGIFLYELDAVGRCSSKDIAERYSSLPLNFAARYDIANMDIGKKGWTRYYPFSIGDKDFIMRIFLTTERSYQPDALILYEGSISNPAVTFQVLPSLNEILSDCKIVPRKSYSYSEAGRCP